MEPQDESLKGSAGGKARSASLTEEQRKEIAQAAAKARWEKKKAAPELAPPPPPVYKAEKSGELRIGSWLVSCHVLDNGMRVVSQRAMMELLDIRGRSNKGHERLLAFMEHPAFTSSSSYKNMKLALQEPVRFLSKTGLLSFGFTGETVVDYCGLILQARKSTLIEGETIRRAAIMAEALVTSVAKVGIIALIDEATGHQETRERDELQKHLERYLKKEFAAWAKRFPDEFYIELFRLRGWQWKGMKINRPQVVGMYTNDLIYSRMTPGILEELERLNPINENGLRHHRHHQHLTFDIGHPHLQQHLFAVLGMMRACNSWGAFIRLLDRAFPRIGQTYALALNDDELNPDQDQPSLAS
jgi:hypothetical protein